MLYLYLSIFTLTFYFTLRTDDSIPTDQDSLNLTQFSRCLNVPLISANLDEHPSSSTRYSSNPQNMRSTSGGGDDSDSSDSDDSDSDDSDSGDSGDSGDSDGDDNNNRRSKRK